MPVPTMRKIPRLRKPVVYIILKLFVLKIAELSKADLQNKQQPQARTFFWKWHISLNFTIDMIRHHSQNTSWILRAASSYWASMQQFNLYWNFKTCKISRRLQVFLDTSKWYLEHLIAKYVSNNFYFKTFATFSAEWF